ncbi:MAG: hypothetical protein AAF368_13640, partial [Planctomycetota bacterium]
IEDREIEALRRVKDEVKEVRVGTECGIRIKGFEDVKVGDRIVCYAVKEVIGIALLPTLILYVILSQKIAASREPRAKGKRRKG